MKSHNKTNPLSDGHFIHIEQWVCHWVQIMISVMLTAGSLLVVLGCVPESPRWLKATGNVWTAVHELQRLGNVIDSVALHQLGQNTPPHPASSVMAGNSVGGGGTFVQRNVGASSSDPESGGGKCCWLTLSERKAGIGMMALVILSQIMLPYSLLLRPAPPLVGPETLFPDDPSLEAGLALAVLACGIYVSSLLLDSTGRRPLLMASFAGMSVSALLTAFFSSDLASAMLWFLQQQPQQQQHTAGGGGARLIERVNLTITTKWIASILMHLYIFSHGLGLSTIPWVLASEISSQRFRSLTCSTCAFGFLLAAALVSLIDPLFYKYVMAEDIGPDHVLALPDYFSRMPLSAAGALPPHGPFPFLHFYVESRFAGWFIFEPWFILLAISALSATCFFFCRTHVPELKGLDLDYQPPQWGGGAGRVGGGGEKKRRKALRRQKQQRKFGTGISSIGGRSFSGRPQSSAMITTGGRPFAAGRVGSKVSSASSRIRKKQQQQKAGGRHQPYHHHPQQQQQQQRHQHPMERYELTRGDANGILDDSKPPEPMWRT
eukprot:jgi/Bigna1/125403/aug1.1_g111